MVYKYMSTERFFEHIDEYLDGKLYFAGWDDLNDPMEGYFSINKNENTSLKCVLKDVKYEYKICTTSESYSNFLLWSHYADKHKGVCLGIEIEEQECQNECITHSIVCYVEETLYLRKIEQPLEPQIEEILNTKMDFWKYEEEYRFFKRVTSSGMLKIGNLNKIILGKNCPYKDFFSKYVRIRGADIQQAVINHKNGGITLEPVSNNMDNIA